VQINISYDASIANAPAGFKTAVQAAVEYLESVITTPITVNIAFGYGEVDGQAIDADALGESLGIGSNYGYSQVVAALTAAATSPDDFASIAALPLTDPTNASPFLVTNAEAKALGLYEGGTDAIDGYVGLSAAAPFTFDPANRAVSNGYDAIGTLEHEITEVLGRVAYAGESLPGGAHQYAPLDLFRYLQSGELATTSSTASFSIDGQLLLKQFDNGQGDGDPGDWETTYGIAPVALTKDAFDGLAIPGVADVVTAVDLRVIDVLGYSIAGEAPSRGDLSAIVGMSSITASAYDAQRNVFYIGTSTGVIEAFNPESGALTVVAKLSDDIQGLAISPDGSALYAGQTTVTNSPANAGITQGAIDQIDLNDLSVHSLGFAVSPGELGTYSVAIAPNGTGYFSTNYNGSSFEPLRAFAATGATFSPTTVPELRGISEDTLYGPELTLSENGKYLLVAETSDSGGSLYLVNALTGDLMASTTSFALGDGGSSNSSKDDVNDAAGLVVDLSDQSLLILDTSLHVVKDLTSIEENPSAIIGAHFSEDGSELYLWDETQQNVLIYSTSSWQQVGSIPVDVGVADRVLGASPVGQMSLADDGRLLFLSTGSGFEVVDLRPGIHPADFDGDGRSDILFGQSAGGPLADWQMGGTSIIGGGTIGAPGGSWSEWGVGDFNGDGRMCCSRTARAIWRPGSSTEP
jgi:WD40 repeat protein